MAASRNWSSSTKEHSNFARLCRLLIDGGTLVVKEVFDSIHPPRTLYGVLHNSTVHGQLKFLRAKKVINTQQWNKLYPSVKSSVTSSSFDITLLIVLLRNICSLTPPATGWDKPPAPGDTSKEADLARIKCYRNELYGHITSTRISDGDFEGYWNEIEALLSRLSASRYQDDIKRLKVETMEPEDEEHFVRAIEEWEESEKRIMSKLEEVIKLLKPSESTSVADDSRCKDYTMKLKSSIKSQTDFQPGLKEGKRIRTDDIFTNVTLLRGQKQLKKHQTEGEGEDDSTHGHSVLKKCSELFTFPVESDAPAFEDTHRSYPRSILVTGQAGIGKTLFSQELARDWANETLFDDEDMTKHPDFQFVFLLTFRQLNQLGRKKLNLRELLNRSSLLNEQSNLDDAVFEYLLQNPEKLLLIIDGYDEYSHGDEVTGDSDVKYPNNPREKMPVPALVAKLLKGKMLQDSVVMIISRPGNNVHDLRENFDVQVEITGFSSLQVLEFVEKYFKDDESMKKMVLHHFLQHKSMLEFVHVPVICLLVCCFLEWHLTYSDGPVNLPVTRTDLYHEVTKVFIRKHHLHLKYAKKEEADRVVQETFGKLSKLAAKLLEEKKYSFDEEDLHKFKFCKKDMDILKTSGVLYCCPGIRKSPFAEVTHEYAFIHLTVQEHLAAYYFVEQRRIPVSSSGVVLQFMSGLLAKKKDEVLMTELLDLLASATPKDQRRLVLAKCLYEYGDTNVAKGFISHHFDEFCDDGSLSFSRVIGSNSVCGVTFVLDVMTQLHEEQLKSSQSCDKTIHLSYIKTFRLHQSHLTAVGVRQIASSLKTFSCTVTKLQLRWCRIQDDSIEAIVDLLQLGKLVELDLKTNDITDKGVSSICESLTSENCKLTTLYLSFNEITKEGVSRICESLTSENCKLTTLDLSGNKINDKGVSSIGESLTSENCKLTNLALKGTNITDKGVSSIREALVNKNCELTTLDLGLNQITDEGVSSICECLTSEHCNLQKLDLSGNRITDKGAMRICQSVIHDNCKLSKLTLGEGYISVLPTRNYIKNPGYNLLNFVKQKKPHFQLIFY